jgi:hypothetical protein
MCGLDTLVKALDLMTGVGGRMGEEQATTKTEADPSLRSQDDNVGEGDNV